MGVSVDYTYAVWQAAYPEFTAVTSARFDNVYTLAQQYCVNDGTGLASTTAIQTNLLGLMCSHIAQLFYGSSSQAARNPTVVGRITDATEGSVTARTEMGAPGSPLEGWLQQTQYGAMYLVAIAPYRTMQYRPKLRRQFNPWPTR